MTVTETTELVVMRCWCGVLHGVPHSLWNLQQHQHNDGLKVQDIFCPLGHSHVPAYESECSKLRKALDRERAASDQVLAELRETKKDLEKRDDKIRRVNTRLKNGVCPCCHRSFQNLRRHMATKHKDFAPTVKSAGHSS